MLSLDQKASDIDTIIVPSCLERKCLCWTYIDASSTFDAIGLMSPLMYLKLHGTLFLTLVAFDTPGSIQTELLFLPAYHVLHSAHGTKGAPGTGTIKDAH